MYVVPTEENCDDSYEPPPSEHEPKTVPIPFTCAQGVYAGMSIMSTLLFLKIKVNDMEFKETEEFQIEGEAF